MGEGIFKQYRLLFGLFIIIPFLVACSEDSSTTSANETDYTYEQPADLNDGWQTGSVADAGLNETTLTQMIDYINNTHSQCIYNILIFKNNQLVFEKYFDGFLYSDNPPGSNGAYISYRPDIAHFLASVTKSVSLTLFGIAIDKGFVEPDVTLPVIHYFPQYSDYLDEAHASVQILHLLTMTSGLDWNENTYPYGDSRNDVYILFNTGDPIRFVLMKSMHGTPGTIFHYNSGATNVLAEIVHQGYGEDFLQFAEEYLFGPLEITNYRWDFSHGDYVFASGGLYLTPRDLAKIGYLFLNNGTWNNQQIVSQEWVQRSTQSHIIPTMALGSGYGYLWWIKNFYVNGQTYHSFKAMGWGGQEIFIFRKLNMVVVFTGANYVTNPLCDTIMQNYILPALQ